MRMKRKEVEKNMKMKRKEVEKKHEDLSPSVSLCLLVSVWLQHLTASLQHLRNVSFESSRILKVRKVIRNYCVKGDYLSHQLPAGEESPSIGIFKSQNLPDGTCLKKFSRFHRYQDLERFDSKTQDLQCDKDLDVDAFPLVYIVPQFHSDCSIPRVVLWM